MNQHYPKRVEIIEVGPRDGLQREETFISTEAKVNLILKLIDAGLKRIQVTSFVHPKLVPQMADAEQICAQLPVQDDLIFSGLALNLRGVARARDAGLSAIDISVSANNDHSLKNANRTIEAALGEFEKMISLARESNMMIRGGIQCAFGYQKVEDVQIDSVIDIARKHLELGVDELAIADSSGLANPLQIADLLKEIVPMAGERPVILHLHDTRGMGLANVHAGVRAGVRHFDTSFGGLGGCPFIQGATGNIATEDTAYMLHEMGIETGINLKKLSRISREFEERLGKTSLPGKLYQLLIPEREHSKSL